MSNYTLASSQDGSRRGRTLYADAESARQNIMRLPSGPYTAATPEQESPLAGRGNTSTAVDNDSGAEPIGHSRHPDANISRRRTSFDDPDVMPDDSVNSLRSDPFDLRLSVDAGVRLNNIDEVMRPHPRMSTTSDFGDEGADAVEAYVPSSRPSPFRFVSALTKCFLQDRLPSGPRLHRR